MEQDGVITWNGNLPGEISFIFTATVDVDPSVYGQSITNSASFTSDNAGTGSASAMISVGTPVLSITKSVETAHDPALPGDPITYTIVVNNDGNVDAIAVHMWDVLPEGVIGENVDITDTIRANQAYTITIPATLTDDNSLYGQTITNTAEYATTYAGGGSAQAVFTLAGAPIVTISKSVESVEPLNLGDVVTYTMSLSNSGEAAALNLTMTDTLPAEIDFGGWLLQNGAVEQDGVITWNGNLPGEISFIFTATVDVDPSVYGQNITNTATFTSDNAGSGSASATIVVGTPVLSITKSVETAHVPALPGDPITYTLVVSNDGTAAAVDTHIWDVLPEGVIGEDVNLTVTIATGTAHTITIPATLAADVMLGSTITNTAFYENGDLNGESSASLTIWWGEPVLSITKTVEVAHDPALPGDPITYTLVVRNDGTADAVDTHIWDLLPEGVIGEDVDVTVTIQPGTAYTITISATLAANVAPGSTITNTASYESGDLNGESSASFSVKAVYKIYLPFTLKH